MSRHLRASDYVNGSVRDGPITRRVSYRPPPSDCPSWGRRYRPHILDSLRLGRSDDAIIGIWLSPPGPSAHPFFTFVGSSNLSNRSLKYDTELSLLLMTSSPSLRKALGQEVQNLQLNARDVGEETWKEENRRVSWLAWLLIKLGVEGYL